MCSTNQAQRKYVVQQSLSTQRKLGDSGHKQNFRHSQRLITLVVRVSVMNSVMTFQTTGD